QCNRLAKTHAALLPRIKLPNNIMFHNVFYFLSLASLACRSASPHTAGCEQFETPAARNKPVIARKP
ncbi:MAG: hypothetical protein VX663_00920, partial [Pseudomonadota bacterium]|nr:hypothetical protein [Pseudomonadota bacterium]